MARNNSPLLFWAAELVPWLTLFSLLAFLYARLFVVPYTGFKVTSSGEIDIPGVFAGDNTLLEQGDVIVAVDGVAWEELRAAPRQLLFADATEGSSLRLTILPGGEGD